MVLPKDIQAKICTAFGNNDIKYFAYAVNTALFLSLGHQLHVSISTTLTFDGNDFSVTLKDFSEFELNNIWINIFDLKIMFAYGRYKNEVVRLLDFTKFKHFINIYLLYIYNNDGKSHHCFDKEIISFIQQKYPPKWKNTSP